MSPEKIVNPYNFARFLQMAPDARREPIWHSAGSQQTLHSGRLICRLKTLTPTIILNHRASVKIPLPRDESNQDEPESKGRENEANQADDKNTFKVFPEFYHHGDGIPTIPGSSLKGMIRSVAEAAVNGCLSVYSRKYAATKESKKATQNTNLKTDLYEQPFDIDLHIRALNLQPCSHPIVDPNDASTGLCPTCRLFGMTAKDEGEKMTGAVPLAFAGKVSFGDARCQLDSQANPYGEFVLPAEQSSPDGTSYLYYLNGEVKKGGPFRPIGRKFYYHQPTVREAGSAHKETALEIWQAHEADSKGFPVEALRRGRRLGLHRLSLVRPLAANNIFEFTVDFHGLTEDELNLLFFALELEANEDTDEKGAHHKLGYAKSAGLGSVQILISEWLKLDEAKRYAADGGNGWEKQRDVHKAIGERKDEFVNSQKKDGQISDNLLDLCLILEREHSMDIRFPKLQDFGQNKAGTQGPKFWIYEPGNEPGRGGG